MLDSHDGPPPRVLLADDDQNFLSLATIQLKRSGFLVTPVSDGARAIEVLDRATADEAFDLLVLDILMPGATGWEVLAHAIENVPTGNPLPRVLLITGFNAEFIVDMDMVRREGAAGILLKPFDGDEFLDEVRRVLAMERLVADQNAGAVAH